MAAAKKATTKETAKKPATTTTRKKAAPAASRSAAENAVPVVTRVESTGIGVKTLLWVGVLSAAATALAMSLAGAALLAAVLWFRVAPQPSPSPESPVDSQFVKLGEAYVSALAKTYAEAWLAMANQVDAGQPIGVAVQAFEADWRSRRGDLFAAKLAGPFKAIIPEGTTEDQITTSQRAAYSAACRGVAKGLSP